ncbi:hypothetical protein [Streptomyces sp. NPDC046371]|uniref:hypothetical protein n=1 Tax=Streptomyces sp. NPDC046371 TaxID=3154916 RepID=UPI0034078AEC
MGRKRPNKPRRAKAPRQRGYTLRELEPPGDSYDEWLDVPSGARLDQFADPRLGEEERDFLQRLSRIAPLYGHDVPLAGVVLDTLIDTGHLPVYQGEDDCSLVPLQQIAGSHPEMTEDSIRESVHRLHSVGAFLLVSVPEQDLALVRFVSRKPERPGDEWGFMDDKSVPSATTCVPNDMWDELPMEVAAAVMYLRSCKSRLRTPELKGLVDFVGNGNVEQAKDLWNQAHASGYVDYKGCEACPTGHLCTRDASQDDEP